jgi:hypothetical protein
MYGRCSAFLTKHLTSTPVKINFKLERLLLVDEVDVVFGPVERSAQSWGWVSDDLKERPSRVHRFVGRPSVPQLYGGDAQSPDVRSVAVILSGSSRCDDFGGHPARRPQASVGPVQGTAQAPREAEIDQFHLPLFRQQNVPSVDVPVDGAILVEEYHCLQQVEQ